MRQSRQDELEALLRKDSNANEANEKIKKQNDLLDMLKLNSTETKSFSEKIIFIYYEFYIVSLVTCSLKWLLLGSRKVSHLWKRAGNSKWNDKTKPNKIQHNNKINQDRKTQQNKKENKQTTYINNFHTSINKIEYNIYINKIKIKRLILNQINYNSVIILCDVKSFCIV